MSEPSEPGDELAKRRLSALQASDGDLIDEDPPQDDEDFSDVIDVAYRGRGRPKLPPEQKRREKLVIALTGEELKRFMIEAASAEGGPLRVQDWARRILLQAAPRKDVKP